MADNYYKEVFSRNLKYYMELNHKTQVDIINDLGYDKSAVSTWCLGSRLPRMDKVDALAKYLGVRRSDLIDERKPLIVPDGQKISGLADPELELIKIYRSLNDEGREKISDYARLLSRDGSYIKNNEFNVVEKDS